MTPGAVPPWPPVDIAVQRVEIGRLAAAVLDAVLTTAALLCLGLWSVAALLYGPLLMVTAGDSCGPQDTALICTANGSELVGFLPGASAAYAFVLAAGCCFGGRAARCIVIPAGYAIAAVGAGCALYVLSGAR